MAEDQEVSTSSSRMQSPGGCSGDASPTDAAAPSASTSAPLTVASPPPSICVAVRKRPKLADKEHDETDIIRCDVNSVTVYEPRKKLDLTRVIEPSTFKFDSVFGEDSTNEAIYEDCCQPLLQTVREGGGAVIFAFGQTGSGKTFTMLGGSGLPGLYSLAVTELLETTSSEALTASFYEVYGSKLFDLLNDRAEVKMLQDENRNIHIVGLTERKVHSAEDIDVLMTSGQQLRAIGTTHANDRSSRSHAVLEIKVQVSSTEALGRITFVDLAGSERASDTAETDAKTRREGAEINKSLLALKECVRAMSMRKRHIPFRGSKLTQILRESFTGRCKTCIIATISPCQSHCEDTINTLRYANRIKELKSSVIAGLVEAPVPCRTCGMPIFPGERDKHVCKRQMVQCPHCRQEMEKATLEQHFNECREVALRCQYCNERMLRADQARHNRRCYRYPVRCTACGQQVQRSLLEKHAMTDCVGAREKCRYCGLAFLRQALVQHESTCDAMRVACSYCLRFIRKNRMEAHLAVCVSNPSRGAAAASSAAAGGANPTSAAGGAGGRLSARSSPTQPPTSAALPQIQLGDQTQQQQQQRQQSAGGGGGKTLSTANMGSTAQWQEAVDCVQTPTPTSTTIPAVRQPRGGSSIRNNHYRDLTAAAAAAGEAVCPYSRYGCPVKVTSINIHAHLTEAMSEHLELVTTYANTIDVQNAALRRLVVMINSKDQQPPASSSSAAPNTNSTSNTSSNNNNNSNSKCPSDRSQSQETLAKRM